MKRTRKDIEQILEVLRNKTKRDYFLDFSGSPQRPRLCERVKNGGGADISPRLSITDLYQWLEAFDMGLRVGEGAWWVCEECGSDCLWKHSNVPDGSPTCVECGGGDMVLDMKIAERT